MNLKLKTITLHHFLSFDESTITLDDRGFCLVSGINRNPKDAAKSNGSGKSTIFNAISYVLTGETLQGLKSNLGNIYFNDGCWVSLEFTLDGHEYKLLRSSDDKKYGTNLKIIVDGEDKSGKGIKESREVLDELLPDITSELIGSVILIGQGMPQKFTNNTPAKRKEILEHLSKSDFMIQDLKDRVDARSSLLSLKIREYEDKILSHDSKLTIYNKQLDDANIELQTETTQEDFDSQIKELQDELHVLNGKSLALDAEKNVLDTQIPMATFDFTNITKEKSLALDKVRTQHDEQTQAFNQELSSLNGKIFALETEIKKLKAVTDVCPTCGQKIPGAIKPDTTKQEEELTTLKNQLLDLKNDIQLDIVAYSDVVKEISKTFDSKVQEAEKTLLELQSRYKEVTKSFDEVTTSLGVVGNKLTKVWSLRENHENNIKRIQSNINDLKELIVKIEEEKRQDGEALESLKTHLEVISKMSTFLKRDFRGFLLENIISFISNQAKDYCSQIFGSDEIVFALDGNNIDISYCGKDYENLSGGEKQRVDLIIQFAIRSLLVNYLGFNCNILVLDEITDNLDSVSCDKVLNFITKELSTIDSVFIISHHSQELDIPCDSEIVVEKNELGVSEVR